ncbi:MAG: hypothetical protein H7Y36_12080 [Armatimonadetes bacterium]|nr:hypothetical protein [Akkermansiaceae bacterium]
MSPAIRHRLISEDEVAFEVLQFSKISRVEKFLQEIYWRRYWKAWLSLRPQVWGDYLQNLTARRNENDERVINSIERAESGNPVIDHFSRELVDTGYLHNHARMWFAAWWVHEVKLPWELGADFFYKHLLDGDPASNTLSWRWVAGLQTPGKTYLARRANLEKYIAPEILESMVDGLSAFENPHPYLPEIPDKPPITRPDLPGPGFHSPAPTGLWIHEEDLSPESSPLAGLTFSTVFVTGHPRSWERHSFPLPKRRWLTDALADTCTRASQHWKTDAVMELPSDLASSLVQWAKSHRLAQITTLRPGVGPLEDALSGISAVLNTHGIQLIQIDRPQDLLLRPLATGSFFQFWEKMRKLGFIPFADKQD